jgi:hypothetical protein
MENIEG